MSDVIDGYFAPLDTVIPSKELNLTLDTNPPNVYNLKRKYNTSLLGVHKDPVPGPQVPDTSVTYTVCCDVNLNAMEQKKENKKEEHSVTANTTFSVALCLQKFVSHSYF